ncbi:MAG: MBL fold metallo-hydrolase [Clostridia bacterium]|nr:MBL fold metallo-hydrolase [Clostridia bacterium]
MNEYTKIGENIYYLKTSYKDIYTTVYLIKTDKGYMLFDSASFDCDIDNAIAPMLSDLGVSENELKYVFISHAHADHMGGLKRFLQLYPSTTVITKSTSLAESLSGFNVAVPEENETFLDVLKVILVPGHSACSQAILDTRDNTLITGDCLQLYGIFGSGNWACNISLPAKHFAALDKLDNMNISAIYTAHDYHPLGQFYVGAEAVKKAVEYCREPLKIIMKMIEENPESTDEEIAAAYNKDNVLPRLGAHVVKNLRGII